ncbi:MAG: alpha/beta hydrolase [Halodesulfurarchaeum sp.]|nr:alpha/beta hydrolase [Halodesulfurarchaeum sp.]
MPGRSRIRTALTGERIAIWSLGLLVVAAALIVGFAGTTFAPPAGSVESVERTHSVAVAPAAGGYTITPAGKTAETGLVFYPGARVEPGAYVPVLAPVVEETGAAVFVPRPRLNLAVFESGMATSIVESNPAIADWYVGGHSLGGAMACRYAADNADRLEGLVLFGAYCDRSIADADLRVLAVGGTRDTVLGTERSALRPENLPESAIIRRIEGLNHTQFGRYHGQSGDSPATITRETAHERLQSVLVDFLREKSQ